MGFWPIKRWILGREVGATLVTSPATDNGMKGKSHVGMSVAGVIKDTPYNVRTAKGQGNWELCPFRAPDSLDAVDLVEGEGIAKIIDDMRANPDATGLVYVAKQLGLWDYDELLMKVNRALSTPKTHMNMSPELRDWVMQRWLDLESAEEVEGG